MKILNKIIKSATEKNEVVFKQHLDMLEEKGISALDLLLMELSIDKVGYDVHTWCWNQIEEWQVS
jgi:hypothetical protein